MDRPSEISYLQTIPKTYDILRFDISMHNTLFMKIDHSCSHLIDKMTHDCLIIGCISDYSVIEVALPHFHNEVDIFPAYVIAISR